MPKERTVRPVSPAILVICGPTASGKTRLGVELALRLGGEVISADSMQIYRDMDIGTAKPTMEERRGIPHHMLDVAEPWENWSVARYAQAASACAENILSRGKLPIVVGGTGLYIDALVTGRDFAPFTGTWRRLLQERAKAEGMEVLYEELRRIDPERAARLAIGDEKRIIRALEVWHETGQTISEHDARTRKIPPRYRAVTLGLAFARREDMWAQIDKRVDEMVSSGLVNEVRGLLASGIPENSTAMQAIGYKEIAAALRQDGELERAIEEIKLRTRQYAKRQLTWFRRNKEIYWQHWDTAPVFSQAVQNSTAYLEEYGLR
ncbi:tRNA dimethylallyltransferase [bioreactor metagenome]|uniref:tRNA dimethylallyltransferase n=1 Tax=bioreactor metagenome TaxID=1076179 RepID=A0A644ZDX7_9ZZZZ